MNESFLCWCLVVDFIVVVWGVKKVDVVIFKFSVLFGNVIIFIG